MKDKPIVVPWYVTRGDNDSIEISMIDSSANIPLLFETGDTVFFSVKEDVGQSMYLIQKEITTFNEGLLEIDLLPEDTNSLEFGNYVYDVKLHKLDGFKQHLIDVSPFVILEVVTND